MYRNHTQSNEVTLFFCTTLTQVQMSMKYLKTPSVQDYHSALCICSFIIYPLSTPKSITQQPTCVTEVSLSSFPHWRWKRAAMQKIHQEQHPPSLPMIASFSEWSNVCQEHRHTKHGLWKPQSRLRGPEFTGMIRNCIGFRWKSRGGSPQDNLPELFQPLWHQPEPCTSAADTVRKNGFILR